MTLKGRHLPIEASSESVTEQLWGHSAELNNPPTRAILISELWDYRLRYLR